MPTRGELEVFVFFSAAACSSARLLKPSTRPEKLVIHLDTDLGRACHSDTFQLLRRALMGRLVRRELDFCSVRCGEVLEVLSLSERRERRTALARRFRGARVVILRASVQPLCVCPDRRVNPALQTRPSTAGSSRARGAWRRRGARRCARIPALRREGRVACASRRP